MPLAVIAWMGLTGASLYYVFYNAFLYYTTASRGTLVQSFMPVVTALLAALVLKESLSAGRVLGVGVSTAGVLLIMAHARPGGDAPNSALGNGRPRRHTTRGRPPLDFRVRARARSKVESLRLSAFVLPPLDGEPVAA